jgi:hypothetical protein
MFESKKRKRRSHMRKFIKLLLDAAIVFAATPRN